MTTVTTAEAFYALQVVLGEAKAEKFRDRRQQRQQHEDGTPCLDPDHHEGCEPTGFALLAPHTRTRE
jgi:hypothetical protein